MTAAPKKRPGALTWRHLGTQLLLFPDPQRGWGVAATSVYLCERGNGYRSVIPDGATSWRRAVTFYLPVPSDFARESSRESRVSF
jgi:hypothetical protein